METIKKIWFEKERIFLETSENKIYHRPLEAFPILKEANDLDRNQYKIGKDKTDIRWETLDEDLHISSFYEKGEPDYENSIALAFKSFPEINISAFAKQIGINKSLLAKYIYGIKKPSEQRKKEIENALHQLGQELLTVKI